MKALHKVLKKSYENIQNQFYLSFLRNKVMRKQSKRNQIWGLGKGVYLRESYEQLSGNYNFQLGKANTDLNQQLGCLDDEVFFSEKSEKKVPMWVYKKESLKKEALMQS